MINIVGTIYDNSSLHTVALANQVLDEEYHGGKKQSDINKSLDQRISTLAATQNNKGIYDSVESLEEKQSAPEIGEWAIVREEEKLIIYVCNVAGQWQRTEQEYQQESTDLSDIEDRISDLEDRVSDLETNGPTQGGDGIKHVILTQVEYDALETYPNDTIYFIVEPISNTWTFGGTFPIIFAPEGVGTFPITLT